MSERKYFDITGMEVSLEKLVQLDNGWACNRIRRCAELEEALNRRALESGQAEPAEGQEPVAYIIENDGCKMIIFADSLVDVDIAEGNEVVPLGRIPPNAQPQRAADDALWDQTLKERDQHHDAADNLAHAIAGYFGQDFGEHSNLNNPWIAALEFMESQPRRPAVPVITDDMVDVALNEFCFGVTTLIKPGPSWNGRMKLALQAALAAAPAPERMEEKS